MLLEQTENVPIPDKPELIPNEKKPAETEKKKKNLLLDLYKPREKERMDREIY